MREWSGSSEPKYFQLLQWAQESHFSASEKFGKNIVIRIFNVYSHDTLHIPWNVFHFESSRERP